MIDPAVQALCDLLAAGVGPFRGPAIGDMATIDRLRRAGVLVEAGHAPIAWCANCDAGHLAAIVRDDDGRLGWICPETGFVAAEADAIRQFQIDMDRLISDLARGGTMRTATTRAGDEPIRVLGEFGLDTLRVRLVLAPRLQDVTELQAMRDFLQRLSPADITLVLVPNGEPSVRISLNPSAVTWPLANLVAIAPDGRLWIVRSWLDRVVRHLLPAAPPARPGRPSGLDVTRAALEELRRRGLCPVGRNAIARALHEHWADLAPGTARPSEATLKKHVSELR